MSEWPQLFHLLPPWSPTASRGKLHRNRQRHDGAVSFSELTTCHIVIAV
ncbi:hypothetical protein XHC_0331 [Xanthomonas hortorum pv. carotae str. M081]|nr:hypothetical protein XHC_0331 [Xanthomonas hortorum pv. carotae str. M081]